MDEKQAAKRKYCSKCNFYQSYYTKCADSFEREEMGYCSKINKPRESGERCDGWERRPYGKFTYVHKVASLKALTQIARDLAVITQILCEKKEE